MKEYVWPPSDEELIELYINQGKTSKELAELYGKKEKTIRDKLYRRKIRRTEDRGEWFPTEEEFYELYIVQNKTMDELAEYYGVTKSAINHYISRRGLLKSMEQRIENTRKTLKDKYGTTNVREIPGVNEKIFFTNQERYGTGNPFGNKEVREKGLNTMREKYGIENNISQSKEIQEKKKRNIFEKYGVSSFTLLPEVQEKRRKTSLEKYGVDCPSKSQEVKAKVKNTMLERYGVENMGSLLIPEKTREIFSSKENFESYLVSSGFDTTPQIAKDLECSIFTVDLKLKQYGLWKYINNALSSGENELKDLISSWGVIVEKNRKILYPYEIDIYCPEKRVGIEFNGEYWHSTEKKKGDYHGKKSLCALKKGVAIIHIYEQEWNTNKDEELNKIHKILFDAIPGDYESGEEVVFSLDDGSVFSLIKSGREYEILEVIEGSIVSYFSGNKEYKTQKAGYIKVRIK